MSLPFFYHHFGRLVTGVEVRGHLEPISAGIIENEVIAFMDFVDGAIPCEGVGLANITDDRVSFWRTVGVADVLYPVIGVIEHGADEMVEAAVHADEGSSICLLHHIDPGNEIAAFADHELARLEPDLQGTAAGIGVAGECFFHFSGQQLHIRLHVTVFIRHLETSAQVDELQVAELRYNVEEDLNAFYKNIYILDLAACVDMEIGYAEVVLLNDIQHFIDLIDGDAELALVVAGGDLQITACHDIGAKTDAHRIAMPKVQAEFLQVGKAVYIDDHTQALRFNDLVKRDTIGGVEDVPGGKACLDGQFYFIDGAAVDIGAEAADIFKDVDIGEGLAGVKEPGLAAAESGGQLVVLFFYLLCVVDV